MEVVLAGFLPKDGRLEEMIPHKHQIPRHLLSHCSWQGLTDIEESFPLKIFKEHSQPGVKLNVLDQRTLGDTQSLTPSEPWC